MSPHTEVDVIPRPQLTNTLYFKLAPIHDEPRVYEHLKDAFDAHHLSYRGQHFLIKMGTVDKEIQFPRYRCFSSHKKRGKNSSSLRNSGSGYLHWLWVKEQSISWRLEEETPERHMADPQSDRPVRHMLTNSGWHAASGCAVLCTKLKTLLTQNQRVEHERLALGCI